MTDPVAASAPRSKIATALLIASSLLLVLQLWNLSSWYGAFNAGTTQPERVAIYLERAPFGLGLLGTFGITWLLIACGVLGAACAVPAARGSGKAQPLGVILIVAQVLFACWLLFTLM